MEERAAQSQPAFGELTLIAIAGSILRMILSENRFPLFGIMRAGDGGLGACGRENSVGKPAFVLP